MWDRFREAWPTWEFVIKNSLEVVLPECDVLVLDDLHHYKHVRTELFMHNAYVSERICLHDTAVFGEHGQKMYEAGGDVGAGPDKRTRGLNDAIGDFLGAHLSGPSSLSGLTPQARSPCTLTGRWGG